MQESQAPALATIDAHVAALREALVDTNAYLVVGTGFIDWLELAAGLLDVEIDTGRHDASLMMCGRAREWHSSRSDELACMHTELTRFLYVWCALECLARATQPTRRVGDDDVLDHAAIREHLIHRWTRLPLPSGFEGVVDELRRAVARHPDFGERFVRRLAVSEAYPTCVLGLTAATELRNHFAHGSIVNPDPSEWGGRAPASIAIVALTARALIFTLQMLLASYSYPGAVDAERYDDETDTYQALGVHELLLTAHLPRAA